MSLEIKSEKEQLNSQAYQDCLDRKGPRYPENEDYMTYYRGWRDIAMYPEDTYYYADRG